MTVQMRTARTSGIKIPARPPSVMIVSEPAIVIITDLAAKSARIVTHAQWRKEIGGWRNWSAMANGRNVAHVHHCEYDPTAPADQLDCLGRRTMTFSRIGLAALVLSGAAHPDRLEKIFAYSWEAREARADLEGTGLVRGSSDADERYHSGVIPVRPA